MKRRPSQLNKNFTSWEFYQELSDEEYEAELAANQLLMKHIAPTKKAFEKQLELQESRSEEILEKKFPSRQRLAKEVADIKGLGDRVKNKLSKKPSKKEMNLYLDKEIKALHPKKSATPSSAKKRATSTKLPKGLIKQARSTKSAPTTQAKPASKRVSDTPRGNKANHIVVRRNVRQGVEKEATKHAQTAKESKKIAKRAEHISREKRTRVPLTSEASNKKLRKRVPRTRNQPSYH